MRVFTAVLIALILPLAATAQPPTRYVAGEHYTKLPERGIVRSEDRVEAIEFFLYGCPHCHAFEPRVHSWTEGLGDDVAFRRVPVTFGSAGPIYARVFYTAKVLGVLDEVHGDIFDAIHEQGRPLVERDAIRTFFVEHGVEGAAFDRTFDSDAVREKVEAATALARSYRVTSVPSIGVNGRYWVNSKQAGGNAAMLSVADYLIEREAGRD